MKQNNAGSRAFSVSGHRKITKDLPAVFGYKGYLAWPPGGAEFIPQPAGNTRLQRLAVRIRFGPAVEHPRSAAGSLKYLHIAARMARSQINIGRIPQRRPVLAAGDRENGRLTPFSQGGFCHGTEPRR